VYKVFLERRTEKDLDALDLSLRKRIIERILLLTDNPRISGAKKLTSSQNTWRIRVGSWRIIYEIDDKNKEVKVYRIKHRSIVYRKISEGI